VWVGKVFFADSMVFLSSDTPVGMYAGSRGVLCMHLYVCVRSRFYVCSCVRERERDRESACVHDLPSPPYPHNQAWQDAGVSCSQTRM